MLFLELTFKRNSDHCFKQSHLQSPTVFKVPVSIFFKLVHSMVPSPVVVSLFTLISFLGFNFFFKMVLGFQSNMQKEAISREMPYLG